MTIRAIIHRDRGDGRCESDAEEWPCSAVRQTRDVFTVEPDDDIDVNHIRMADGSCVISLNGQGHLPCSEHGREGLSE